MRDVVLKTAGARARLPYLPVFAALWSTAGPGELFGTSGAAPLDYA